MSVVEVRALGPLEIRLDGRLVPSGGPKQRALVALLTINLNQVVPVGAIVEALWGDDPPDTAVGQIQTAVWRLRRLLADAASGSAGRPDHCLVTRPGGYVLELDPARLDLAVFQEAINQGQTCLRAARYEEAAGILHRALRLWRGRPFDDVPVAFAQAEAGRLEEQRLIAVEDRIETDLALGRHRELVPELRGLVRDHPLRERLRAHLMLALHRSGRQAEALETYADGYRLLTREFGLEPSSQLQLVHRAVLVGRLPAELSALAEPAGGASGRDELPADIVDFIGRPDLIAEACAVLSGATSPIGTPSAVATTRMVGVSGPPGVGKTAFAVRVAHLLRPYFPDGRVYVDLHGLEDEPVPAGEVLNRLLRWCTGRTEPPPEDIEERAALVRSHLADRRMLLVLDNARSEEQVRHLLLDAPGCAILLTSRRQLVALDNLTYFDLAVFQPDEAVALIAGIVGVERVAAEPVAAADIARWCGHLPLAVRIAGARLRARPHWLLRRMAHQLADEHRRLDALSVGDRGVRSSIALSYTALNSQLRRLFRLFGALTDAHTPAWVAAALLDVSEPEAEALLEDLVDARLIEPRGLSGSLTDRYGMHALVRLFARERCTAEEPQPAMVAAAERMVGGWLCLAEQAEHRLPGGLPRLGRGRAQRWPVSSTAADDARDRAVDWFERERFALASAVDTACALELDELAWDLVGCLGRFLEVRGDIDAWASALRRAIAATEAAGNRRGEAHLLRAMGEVRLSRDQYAEALDCLERALGIFEELGDSRARAHVERAIGVLERMRGESEVARVRFTHALTVFEEAGDRVGLADTLFSLGALHRDEGRSEEALACYDAALRLERQLGNRLNQALLLCSKGAIFTALGRLDEAYATLRHSVELAQEIRQEAAEAYAQSFLGEAEILAGDAEAAASHLDSALGTFQRTGDRYGEAITWRNLGDLHRVRGDLDRARTATRRSLLMWDQLTVPVWRARTLLTLGRICLAAGDVSAARDAWLIADDLFGEHPSAEREQVRRLLRETRESDPRAAR